MSVLDVPYKDAVVGSANKPDKKIWCDEDRHNLFEYFTDFNEWFDGDEGLDIRIRYGVDGLFQPSKGFYASDAESYNLAFTEFRDARIKQVLSEEYIQETTGEQHWYERNQLRFDQLIEYIKEGVVVPFVGAGLSVEGNFPSWKTHLKQQGITSGIEAVHIDELIANGQYEEVIDEIEKKGFKNAFIKEIKDVFSKRGKITNTALRLTELFTDTIITTNYDHLIEQAFDIGAERKIQLIDSSNIGEIPEPNKTTVIKLHGDINTPHKCIISKNQYDEAYGEGTLNLTKPIPKLLSYYYRTSNLLFLGCSLNHDRTMQVFQAVNNQLKNKDIYRKDHFSLESMPENKDELVERNNYLLNYGITAIWFPKESYDYIEQILRLAKNELRYRGYEPGEKREYTLPSSKKNTKGFLGRVKKVFELVTDFF